MPNRQSRRSWGRRHSWWRITLGVLDVLAVLVAIGIVMVGFPNVWLIAFIVVVAAANVVAAALFGGADDPSSAT